MAKTVWIVVTGLDGSGKTTLVDNLEKWLCEKGKKVMRDRLPHDEYLVKTLLNASGDSYTDRILFALDNRIFGAKLRLILDEGKYDIILTQRGFLDSFVHGAVQGYSYDMIEELNHIADLPRCDIMIHLVAEASVAYQRICNDPDADKFEYPEYIKRQEKETRRAYVNATKGIEVSLAAFKSCKNIYVDTTSMTTDEVFKLVKEKLEVLL